MATMFPAENEAFTTAGEETVYRFLRRAARPDAVFLAWYSPDIEDREPDFILLSPDSGLIVLEVKDWLAEQVLEADPKSALLQIGPRRERRKQPLAQAREYVNSLLSLLGRHAPEGAGGKAALPCPVTWGAVFPHMRREEFDACGLGEVMDGSRVLCWDDLNEDSPLLRDASGQRLRQWLAEHFPPLFPFSLTPPQVAWLRGCIFPVVRLDLPQRGGASVPEQAATVLALDHEQENLARSFGPGKTLITGPAGSGKTLVLAHQAWNLPRVDRRIRRILITCFNLSLVGYIRRLLARKGVSLGPDSVEVVPFYSLCERILGEPLTHANEGGDYYELVVRECLERLEGDHPLKGRWDAILVDEGQDFSPDMARVLLALLPEYGSLTVAQDEHQCLYQPDAGGWTPVTIPGLKTRRLSRQYRNTRQIAALAARVLGLAPEDAEASGADGPEPRWLASADGRAQVEEVATAVAELVRAGIPMSEIAVLYVRNRNGAVDNLAEALVEALEARGVLARWAARDTASKRGYDITTDSVTISTIHSAKGLDFAQVFLLGLDDLAPHDDKARRLAHVGMTRAREGLTLCTSQAGGLAAALKDSLKGEPRCKNC